MVDDVAAHFLTGFARLDRIYMSILINPVNPVKLFSSGAAISFFHHGAIAAAAKTEPVVHVSFRSDA